MVFLIGVSALSLSDSAKEEEKDNGKRMDLSKPFCHVCNKPLRRSYTQEKEWCINQSCQVHRIQFNISYVYDEIDA